MGKLLPIVASLKNATLEVMSDGFLTAAQIELPLSLPLRLTGIINLWPW